MKNISTLYINRCDNLTDKALEHLEHINELDIYECDNITDDDWFFKYNSL